MKRIICFGDSNTYGYIPITCGRYPKEIRWTGLLQKKARDTSVDIIEEGLCGRTAGFVDDELPNRNGAYALPQLLTKYNDIYGIIIMLGTNDLKTKYNATTKQIANNIDSLINQVKSFDNHIKIMVVSPIFLEKGISKTDSDFTEERALVSIKLKSEIENIAIKQHCVYMAASDFAKAGATDNEHLDEIGHKQLASAFYYVLKKSWLV